jgi:NAD(P)-dependent dehydrogenase (short-subunit alcohol dehydrogenase family)
MKAVLVTGASKGIGEACALRLVQRGFRVFAGVRQSADGAALVAKAAQAGGLPAPLTPLILDVTDPEQTAFAAMQVAEAVGDQGLWGLVNNAGVAVAGPLEFLPIDELRRQLEINVIGQVSVLQAVMPLIRKAAGRVVFIGSVSGRSALPFTGAYAASKFALEAIADALRVEVMPWAIQVSIVEPGVIATPIWETSLRKGEELIRQMSPEAERLYGKLIAGIRRRAMLARDGRTGLPASAVADVVEHALTAAQARTRYVVGRDARMRLLLNTLLPARLRDRLVAARIARL